MTHIPDEAVQAALDATNGNIPPVLLEKALAAALPHLAPCAVEVKKLEWSDPSDPNADCSYDHAFSDTSIGKYQIEWKSWKEYDAYILYLGGDYIAPECDLTSAKAAAQADFERRVRDCIVAKPVDVAPLDANYILYPINHLPSDSNGKCGWTDIANAIDESYRRIRALSAEPA